MENQETIEEAAIRETKEETHVSINKMQLYALFNCPNINQVYFIFRGKVQTEQACISDESSEVKYFNEGEIPWEKLSYSIMNKALEWYFCDKEKGEYPFRMRDVSECHSESNNEE